MDQLRALTRSIILNVSGVCIFHSAFYVALALNYHVHSSYVLWFFVCEALVDGILLGVLLFSRRDFYLLESGKALRTVNFANKLTIFRITSLPSILFLLINSRSYPMAPWLIGYTAIAFLTDLLDGYVSRKTHQTTRVGQYLDSMSDYGVLIGVAIAFKVFGFIPAWLFIVVAIRFVAQWALMGFLFILRKGRVEPRSSFLGKASVFATMVIFGFELFKLFAWFDKFRSGLFVLEIAASLILAVSLGEKVVMFTRELARGRAAMPGGPTAQNAEEPAEADSLDSAKK